MKLLTKTTLYLLYLTVIAFIASGFIFYYSIRTIAYKQLDSNLITEKNIIQEQIDHTDTIPNFNDVAFWHLIEVKIYDYSLKHRQVIKDTLINPNSIEDEVPYQKLYFSNTTKHHKGYTISISLPLSEKKDLLENISISAPCSIYYPNIRYCKLLDTKNLWTPFYKSLEIISMFDINTPPKFSKSDIKEFNKLNQVLESMSEKIRYNYINLKVFNENASHEIQTPLSIIRAKLELLMQYENLNTEQLNLLASIYEAITRLSRINQGLLIISKIDNQQFASSEKVHIVEIFRKTLCEYEEIIQLKKVTLYTNFNHPFSWKQTPYLLEFLYQTW